MKCEEYITAAWVVCYILVLLAFAVCAFFITMKTKPKCEKVRRPDGEYNAISFLDGGYGAGQLGGNQQPTKM